MYSKILAVFCLVLFCYPLVVIGDSQPENVTGKEVTQKEKQPLVCFLYSGDTNKMRVETECSGFLQIGKEKVYVTLQVEKSRGSFSAETILTVTEADGDFHYFLDQHRKVNAYPMNTEEKDLQNSYRYASKESPVDVVVFVCSSCEGQTIKRAGDKKDTEVFLQYLEEINKQATYLSGGYSD